jgi:serine/threonine-protein kinase
METRDLFSLASLPQPYLLVREIGRGGAAIVFEATHRYLGTRLAIKILRPDRRGNPHLKERFEREARLAARLQHPNVVAITDQGFVGDLPYFVMKFEEGGTLAELLATGGRLSARSAVDLLLPVVSAISAAHRLGIIHRDIKPANILLSVDYEGRQIAKLADFGISRDLNDTATPAPTEQGARLGTVGFMAPEQQVDASSVTAAVDQYAFGMVLLECVGLDSEGRRLAVQGDAATTLTKVIKRCLASSPRDRYPSMDDLGRALLEFASPHLRARWSSAFQNENECGRRDLGPPPPTMRASDFTQSEGEGRAPGYGPGTAQPQNPWRQYAIVLTIASVSLLGWVGLGRRITAAPSPGFAIEGRPSQTPLPLAPLPDDGPSKPARLPHIDPVIRQQTVAPKPVLRSHVEVGTRGAPIIDE